MKGVVGLATRHLTDTMKWMNDISYWFLAKLLFRWLGIVLYTYTKSHFQLNTLIKFFS